MVPILKIKYHIKEIREQKKMSLRVLERLSGVSKSAICRIEGGGTHPTVMTLEMIAHALKLPVGELYSLDKE